MLEVCHKIIEWDIQLTSAQNPTISPSKTSGVGEEKSDKTCRSLYEIKAGMWEVRDVRTYSGPRAESMEYGKLSRYLWMEYRKSQRRRINKQAPPKTDYYRGNLTDQKMWNTGLIRILSEQLSQCFKPAPRGIWNRNFKTNSQIQQIFWLSLFIHDGEVFSYEYSKLSQNQDRQFVAFPRGKTNSHHLKFI